MAAPDPYAGTSEEFDPTIHWQDVGPNNGQAVASIAPEPEAIFSKRSAETTIQGIIDAGRIRGFARYCLGYNNQTTSASYRLQRTNPICHPQFTNLVCTGVGAKFFQPIRRTNVPEVSANQGLKIGRNDTNSGVVCSLDDDGVPNTFEYYSGYERALVTIRFGPCNYRLLKDQLTTEFNRNTVIDVEPRTELLTLSGFQLIYAEGGSNTGTTTNAEGKAFPGEVFQVMCKPDVKVTWYDVPEKYISSATTEGQLYPAKILRGLGTVNSGEIFGFPIGTLLLVAVKFTRYPWTLAAGGTPTGSFPGDARESRFNYDVDFLFSHFNPEKGYDTNAQITNYLGHNCQPYRGEPTGTTLAANDLNAGKWFMATYSGLLTNVEGDDSPTLIRYTNFGNLFDSVHNPDI